jgi:hypothetical protein
MKLPNAASALAPIGKLRDYCLNPNHPRGRHKARVFAGALGISAKNADRLRDAILDAVQTRDATPSGRDQFGNRYILDFEMAGLSGNVPIRSHWIVRRDEDFPRLTSCHVL